MGLNCKAGDLAVRIKDDGNVFGVRAGHIVTVLELLNAPSYSAETGAEWAAGTVWLVELNGQRLSVKGNPLGVPDAHLKPLRDTPGDDETLEWAPVPTTLEVV